MDGTDQNRLIEGSVPRKIPSFALPIFLSNLFQQFYSAVSSLIVGNFIGSVALAAMGSSANMIMLLAGLINGVFLGAGVVIARFYGADDRENLSRASHTTVALGITVGLVLTAVGVLLIPQILCWMGAPGNATGNSIAYFRVYFLGPSAIVFYNTYASILQSVGDSRSPMKYLILASPINVVLDLLFMAVFRWGVASAALATTLSQTLSVLLAFRKLTHTGYSYHLSWRQVHLHGDMLRQVVYLGIPSGVQDSAISLASVIIQANISAFGSVTMAGCGAYGKIEGLASLPVFCFFMALAIFASQNIGARRYDRVCSGIQPGLLCSPLLAEATGLGIFVLSPLLIAVFNSSLGVIAYGVADARTASLLYLPLAFSHCCAGVLRGTGRPIIPVAITLAIWCALCIAYTTAVVHFIPDIRVIYWAYLLTWLLGGLLFAVCLLRLRFPSDAALETYK